MIQRTVIVFLVVFLIACSEDGSNDLSFGSGEGTSGVGGSTARFTISGNNLYVVNHSQLKLVDITNPEDPIYRTSIELGGGIETVFSFKQNLFIGGQNGMQIYDISDEENPRYLSQFTHQTACDPVIANDNYAYVTIRDGIACNTTRSVNQLITVDVRDLTNPVEVDRDEMINPRGLAFFKGSLYIGEGVNGLKKFDITNPANPVLDTFYTQVPANDMIGLSHTLIITHDQGIDQMGYKQDSLKLLSVLK